MAMDKEKLNKTLEWVNSNELVIPAHSLIKGAALLAQVGMELIHQQKKDEKPSDEQYVKWVESIGTVTDWAVSCLPKEHQDLFNNLPSQKKEK